MVVKHYDLSSRPAFRTPSSTANNLLCLGDSWTGGPDGGGSEMGGYPAQLQKILDSRTSKGRFHVVNAGRSGLTSTVAAQEVNQLFSRHQPAALVLLAGGDNGECPPALQSDEPKESAQDAPAIRALGPDLRHIAAAAKRHGVRLILLSYPGSDSDRCLNMTRDQLKRLAVEGNVLLVALEESLGPRTTRGDSGREARERSAMHYAPDGHPNAEGYRLMAEAVFKGLQQAKVVP